KLRTLPLSLPSREGLSLIRVVAEGLASIAKATTPGYGFNNTFSPENRYIIIIQRHCLTKKGKEGVVISSCFTNY
ncbi:MAG TPA: hypothetical protein ACFYEF_12190, partial [Candidatus Wunengus sp. YC63]|uniref:hypothetical protein n=1 Tax=Candidatus Wunengus sp. YC63 TaxID=3367699 RepID=UPI0040265D43